MWRGLWVNHSYQLFTLREYFVKKDPRPINVGILDLLVFGWPLPSLTSIMHRISGVVLFIGVGFALYGLEISLASESGFADLQAMLASPIGKFITWGLVSALAYHLVAGTKHLLMDLGIGETLEGGRRGAKLVIFVSIILILLSGYLII